MLALISRLMIGLKVYNSTTWELWGTIYTKQLSILYGL